MEAYEIRALTDNEIETNLEKAYQELFNLRFRLTIGQMKDSSQMKKLKKNIARMKTVLNERRIIIR